MEGRSAKTCTLKVDLCECATDGRPPGLWLAVTMINIPPYAFAERMTPLTHGVDMVAFSPVMIFLTPFAAAMRMIMMAASLLY